MPLAVLIPALFQIAGPLAFLAAVSLAGMLNRSLLIVPLFALAATLTSIFLRWVVPSLRTEIHNIMQPGQLLNTPPPYAGAIQGFVARWVGYGVVFLGMAMLAALFQVTEFEPRLSAFDFWIILIPIAIAIPARLLAHHFGLSRARNFAADLRSALGRDSENLGDAPFTVEGEIISPKSDPDRRA